MTDTPYAGLISKQARYGYIPGLDGIRCFAVMIVTIAHCGYEHIIPGGMGVTIFFFISGFLITRLLLAETEAKERVNLKNFYIRRFLRLLPAYFTLIIVTALVLFANGLAPKLWEWITALTYTMNYYYAYLGFTGEARVAPWEHLWSLAVEEHFYFFFPLLVVAFRKSLDKLMYILVGVCVAALAWRFVTFSVLGWPYTYNYVATETRFDSIAWGCLLSIWLHLRPNSEWQKRLTGVVPFCIGGAFILASLLIRDETFRATARYTFIGIGLFLGVLNLYYLQLLKPIVSLLEIKPIAWIGRVSYGLYLWHMPVIAWVAVYTPLETGTASFTLVATAASLIITAISYYAVERPVIGLRKKYGAHVVSPATG